MIKKFTLLFILTLVIFNIDAQTYFGAQQTITTYLDDARSVYACDIDGDGDLDVLSASWNDDKIAWYRNIDGEGYFGSSNIVTTVADRALSVYACDIDGDGDLDVLSASEGDDKIAWYKNNGSGSFGSQQVITTSADRACSVFACDIDGDGDMDVLSASYGDSKIAWYKNNGSGSFGGQLIISTAASGAKSVYATDIDGDGDLDVLSASYSDDKVAWYENTDGKGTFGSQQVITTSADYAQSIYACDLDNDGDMDVLSASPSDDKIAWYENTDGDGTFGSQQVITTSANYAQSVFACDLDNDGDIDVLSASSLDDKIAWYENTDGEGSFGSPQIITTSADYARSVFACDIDNDGNMDVLSASSNDDRIAWYENFTLKIITQPENSNISCNTNTNFSITAEDVDTYQWQLDEGAGFSDLTDNSPYSGVTTGTLQLTNASSDLNGFQYRCIVSNTGGSISSDTVILIIEDVVDPVITSTHNDQIISANTNCEALLPDYTNYIIVSDNCDLDLDTTQNPISGTIISGTTNAVTLTVTDDAGNSAEVTFNVAVEDNTSPIITSTHNDIYLSDEGNCEATLSDYTGDVVVTDNCDPDLDITQSPMPGTKISGSVNTIVLTAIDDSGNSVEKSFNVGVEDYSDPVVTSTHDDQIIYAGTNCEASLPDYTNNVIAHDNCDENLDIVQVPVASTLISGVSNSVVLTITDDAGNFIEKTFNVEVVDDSEPVINSSPIDQIITDQGNCEAILADYTGDILATDNCDPDLDITQSPLPGTTLSGSVNPVTLTAVDDAGNAAGVTFNIAIEDNTDPIITSTHNDQSLSANANCEVELPDYTGSVTVTDNCDLNLEISQNPLEGTIISGTMNEVILTVTDGAGNTAETTFNVSVIDNTGPEITSTHSNQTLNADSNCEAVLPDYTSDIVATDNCDSDPEITQNPVAGSTISGGTNEITLLATDIEGNSTEVKFNVEIVDNQNPTITCVQDQTFVLASGSTFYTISGTQLDPSLWDDNCSISGILNNFNNMASLDGAQFPNGTTTVTWTITDEAGNENTCSCDVTVNESVGIEDVSKYGISIYPNPTNSTIFFETKNVQIQNIKIYDLTGKMLINKMDLKNKKIDLTEFPSGIYIINISTEKHNFITRILKE